MKAFHIPKTIDNDLLETDHCPGYGSAARFVAHAFQGDDADNRSLSGIKLGKSSEEDGPHLVYVPEKTFNIESFLKEVKEVYDALGRCVVAVSEGVHNEKGEYFLQTYADTLTNIVSEYIEGARVRADTFGYLQRSFIADVSSVDAEEAERVGQHAVLASKEVQSGSIILKRQFSEKYYCEVGTTELHKVAKHTKEMPAEFIDSTKPYVTNEFFEYAMPLTGGIEPKTQIFV